MITFFPTNPSVGRSIATYNDNLARAELGRMQEAVALEQIKADAQARENAMRQNYFQNQQANQLQQQQMQNEASYRNQLLENQRAQTAAQMDWQRALRESVASEADKDRQSRERIATTTAGARSNVPSQVEIDSLNNMAEAAASRYNTMLDLEKRAAEGALDEMEKKRANEWFTSSGTAKTEKGEALKKLREGGYVAQVQRVLSQLGMDKEASGLLQFDGQKFVPKMLRLPGSAGASEAGAPAAAATLPQPSAPTATTNQPTNQTFFSPAQRPTSERRVKVQFPNGAEAEIPESTLRDAQTRLGAVVVPPQPNLYTNPGGAPGAVMAMRQFFTQ